MLILNTVLDFILLVFLTRILVRDIAVLRRRNDDEPPEVGEPVSTESERVASFKKRVAEMRQTMDEDGLYDAPPPPVSTDFTGVEIITNSTEIQQDRRFG